jgi:hypothetical protein
LVTWQTLSQVEKPHFSFEPLSSDREIERSTPEKVFA